MSQVICEWVLCMAGSAAKQEDPVSPLASPEGQIARLYRVVPVPVLFGWINVARQEGPARRTKIPTGRAGHFSGNSDINKTGLLALQGCSVHVTVTLLLPGFEAGQEWRRGK